MFFKRCLQVRRVCAVSICFYQLGTSKERFHSKFFLVPARIEAMAATPVQSAQPPSASRARKLAPQMHWSSCLPNPKSKIQSGAFMETREGPSQSMSPTGYPPIPNSGKKVTSRDGGVRVLRTR